MYMLRVVPSRLEQAFQASLLPARNPQKPHYHTHGHLRSQPTYDIPNPNYIDLPILALKEDGSKFYFSETHDKGLGEPIPRPPPLAPSGSRPKPRMVKKKDAVQSNIDTTTNGVPFRILQSSDGKGDLVASPLSSSLGKRHAPPSPPTKAKRRETNRPPVHLRQSARHTSANPM